MIIKDFIRKVVIQLQVDRIQRGENKLRALQIKSTQCFNARDMEGRVKANSAINKQIEKLDTMAKGLLKLMGR